MLVGRERECRLVERLVAGARVGQSGVLVLVGEAGIGKTALLDQAAAHAGDARVLRTTGTESERDVAFGGLLQLLRPTLGELDGIPAPQADALAVALALRHGAAGDRLAVGAATLSLLSRHFPRALELHARTPDTFEDARTRLAYGSRLRRARRRIDARPYLRDAITAFDRLGARPWADLAATELTATGEKARRRSAGGVTELTPQELQIALMLADGRTTRQAAAALFLSPKTVDYHLRHVYAKLGVHSRAELAAALP